MSIDKRSALSGWIGPLVDSSVLFHVLESFSEVPFCMADAEDTLVYWSQAAEERFRLKSEDLLGKSRAEALVLAQAACPDIKHQFYPWQNAEGQKQGGLDRWFPVDTPSAASIFRPLKDKVETFHGILTCDLAMKQALQIVKNVAETDTTILIRGESGTGKELIAKAIHKESDRHNGAFLAINCAALSPHLLESELFGHVKGAFTGAIKDHHGVFKRADGGTLFLDEVAELPLELQAKLLRVLQERTFTAVGGDCSIQVDVRIVAATHRSLREEVKAGRFREDLMYRLRVVPVFLPALRERRQDISLLLEYFIERHNSKGIRRIEAVEPEAMKRLLDYPWPGNVRELQNVVEYAFAVGREPRLTLANLPPEFREGPPSPAVSEKQTPGLDSIQHALQLSEGRVDEAARMLGMSRATFWRHRKRLGLLQ
ncbi:MAG: sigma-54 interaction domain-containing protein [Methylococcaceae bacterium]